MTEPPDVIEMVSVEQAVVDLPDEPIRKALKSEETEVAALYERVVIAQEGALRFTRVAMAEDDMHWLRAGMRIRHLLASAQRLIEELP